MYFEFTKIVLKRQYRLPSLVISWGCRAIANVVHDELGSDGQGAKSRMQHNVAICVLGIVLSLNLRQTTATPIFFNDDIDRLPHRHPRAPNLVII